MQLSIYAAVIALAASASASCGVGTSGGLTGPFLMKASSSAKLVDGNYAFAKDRGKVLWDQTSGSGATSFYLTSGGELTVEGGKYTIFENLNADSIGQVEVGSKSNSNMKCSLNSDNCSLECKVNDLSYNCLSSPLDKPDWCITSGPGAVPQNCLPFKAVVVPK